MTLNRPTPRLTDSDFGLLASMLHAAAGLTFDGSRRQSLAHCVGERMRVTNCRDVPTYLALLSSPQGAHERQQLLDEVTVPETHFFRNPPQIRALRKHVLPELLRQASDSRRLRVWSAGCSTGEEPYTIAMLLRELVPAKAGWDVKVIATDISTRALAAAERAVYGERSFVMTEPVDRQRFFVLDTEAGGYVVRDEVRDLVEFRHHNLATDPTPFGPGSIDLLLCRNVTIYFDRDITKRLMQRLHACLRVGGYLFLGHAETLWQVSDAFSLVPLGDAFVYRRDDPLGERRRVLPDRRTEDEPLPLRADRRRGASERRSAEPRAELPVAGPGAVPLEPLPDPLISVRAALAGSRYAEAADLAADVAAATPLRAEAHYLQGVALGHLGRDTDALIALRKAVYLDPRDGLAHYLLGRALDNLGEHLAAARSYRAAAGTLAREPMRSVSADLGNRSVAELAAQCHRLARRAESMARPQPRRRGSDVAFED